MMKNKKIIIVIGLPASGKTHYVSSLKEGSTIVIDDFVSKDRIKSIWNNLWKTLILSDCFFCKEDILNNCIKFLKEDLNFLGVIDLMYFENDKEQCLLNAKRRDNKKVDEFIKYLSNTYNPPRESLKVWRD